MTRVVIILRNNDESLDHALSNFFFKTNCNKKLGNLMITKVFSDHFGFILFNFMKRLYLHEKRRNFKEL